MIRAHVLQEVRQMRFEELYGRRHRRELTMAEAAEMLGARPNTLAIVRSEWPEAMPKLNVSRSSALKCV